MADNCVQQTPNEPAEGSALGVSGGVSAAGRPVCVCHGEAMYRNNSNGGWRCRVKVRQRQQPNDHAYWHRAEGGYVKRRRRMLAEQKEQILTALHQTEQEIALVLE